MNAHRVTVRVADLDDIPAAAALLTRAHLTSPDRQLLGSGTTLATSPIDVSAFAGVLTDALRRGHVDLAMADGQVTGVACWITHPTRRCATTPHLPSRPRRGSPTRDLLDRLYLLDLVLNVPARGTHQHLAYLGARPGYGARTITDLLLHRQGLAADRHGHTLYTEVHSVIDRAWLTRRGYHYLEVSLGEPSDPYSFVMTRPNHPSQPVNLDTTPSTRGPASTPPPRPPRSPINRSPGKEPM